MKRRNSCPLAATFMLSLWMAPAALAQEQPGQNQASNSPQNQAQPSQASSDSIQDAKQGGSPFQYQSQPAQANQPKSIAKKASRNPNNPPAPPQVWDAWSASFGKNNGPTRWRVSTGQGPQNEILTWNSYVTMPPLTLAPVDDSLRANLAIPAGQGLVVTAVVPHSPTADAGINENDILLKLGDASLSHSEDFFNRLKAIGEKPVSLTLLREGRVRTIQVQPKIEVSLHPIMTPTAPMRDFWIGVSVTAVEPALRAQLGLPAGGLVVSDVSEDTPALKAGIKRYDILLKVDNEALIEPATLAAYVQAAGEKPIVLHLVRKGKDRMTVTVTPERRKPAAESSAVQRPDPNYYTVFQPGGVVYDPSNGSVPLLTQPVQPGGAAPGTLSTGSYDITWTNANPWQVYPSLQPVASPDPNSSMVKRLDALDAQIKELQKTVTESNRIAKSMVDLQKAVTDSLEALKNKN
jgi:hypothetical protein